MAMFSTYIAFWLISDPEGWQLPFWIGFAITLAISFAGGSLVYGAIIRPLAKVGPDHDRHRHHRSAHHPERRRLRGSGRPSRSTFISPFPFDPVTIGDVAIPKQTIYIFGVSLVCVARRLPHLPLHAHRAHDARRRRASGHEPAARDPRRPHARSRLGAGGRPRRRGRADGGRRGAAARSELHAHHHRLRVRGRRARRPGQPARRGARARTSSASGSRSSRRTSTSSASRRSSSCRSRSACSCSCCSSSPTASSGAR